MSGPIKIIFVTILGIALLACALYFGGSLFVLGLADTSEERLLPLDTDTSLIGSQAPYFDLPDIAGDHTRISDLNNAPLVVVFWSTWNSTSADQVKILDDYISSRQNEVELVHIVAINSQEERSIVSSFIRRGGYLVPTLVDSQGSVSEQYKIKSLPTLYFIDRDGIVREVYSGLISQKMLVDKIEGIVR